MATDAPIAFEIGIEEEPADTSRNEDPTDLEEGRRRRRGRPPLMTDLYRWWPFWAPTDQGAIEAALDLARLVPGERFVDLGCGDGRVLVAAARRGAEVVGVEGDPERAEQARGTLAAADLAGTVTTGDFFSGVPSADVVFAYLSPAVLQRLVPVLNGAANFGVRLVTARFPVPGAVADATGSDCHLYELPVRWQPRSSRPGWFHAGSLMASPARHPSLVGLVPIHPGGRVTAGVEGPLAASAVARTGADEVAAGTPVAIDLRWRAPEDQALVEGRVAVSGLPPYPVLGLVTDGERRLIHVGRRTWELLMRHAPSWATARGPVDELLTRVEADLEADLEAE